MFEKFKREHLPLPRQSERSPLESNLRAEMADKRDELSQNCQPVTAEANHSWIDGERRRARVQFYADKDCFRFLVSQNEGYGKEFILDSGGAYVQHGGLNHDEMWETEPDSTKAMGSDHFEELTRVWHLTADRLRPISESHQVA